jgi:predicted nucleotidyltransferase
MRLSEKERSLIKKAFQESFGSGKVYLFGSRVDDAQRGGDIDLYLVPGQTYPDLRERKRKFLIRLMEYLGEQKIDVIVAQDPSRLIEQEAIRTGIEL